MDIDFQFLERLKICKELAMEKWKLLIEERKVIIFIPMISGSKLLGTYRLSKPEVSNLKRRNFPKYSRQLGDILGGRLSW